METYIIDNNKMYSDHDMYFVTCDNVDNLKSLVNFLDYSIVACVADIDWWKGGSITFEEFMHDQFFFMNVPYMLMASDKGELERLNKLSTNMLLEIKKYYLNVYGTDLEDLNNYIKSREGAK